MKIRETVVPSAFFTAGRSARRQGAAGPRRGRRRRRLRARPSAPARPVTAPPGLGRPRAPGGWRGARGVGRGPGGPGPFLLHMEPGPGGTAGAWSLAAGRGSRRPSGVLPAATLRPAGSWSGKEEAADRAPPEAREGAGAATARRGVPGLRVVVLVAAAGRATPERRAQQPRHRRQTPPLRATRPPLHTDL